MSSAYRWNQAEFAVGYDVAGVYIHPHYRAMQAAILELLPLESNADVLLVDAGGGSGRLAELFLEKFPESRAIVVDQSEPFLALANQRLSPFGGRGTTLLARLQDQWLSRLEEPPAAIVSMSAIHHLSPEEKQNLYACMGSALAPGGVLLNGDEIRNATDDEYLAHLKNWSAHMQAMQNSGNIPGEMQEILDYWREKNIAHFGAPKKSGDDCHETIAVQLDYLRAAGFNTVDAPWQREMWAILRGVKK
jgi:tRNA (cmo5U34)-methyltransferase